MTSPSCPAGQRGIALVAVLLILLIVTLLAVSASRNASQGELIARASRAQQIAFQSAEAALVEARAQVGYGKSGANPLNLVKNNAIENVITPCGGDDRKGMLSWEERTTEPWLDSTQDANWLKRGELGVNLHGGYASNLPNTGVAGVAEQPKYLIESKPQQGGSSPCDTTGMMQYRITAKGYGPTMATEVIVQEVITARPQSVGGYGG